MRTIALLLTLLAGHELPGADVARRAGARNL